MSQITVITCLTFPDGCDGQPIISISPSIVGKVPFGRLTGSYGTRDRNEFISNARRTCNGLGWKFHQVKIYLNAPNFGSKRQDWKQIADCNVLNLFTCKIDVEHDLAILLNADNLETNGILDKQTLIRLNMSDGGKMMERLFADSRMSSVDAVIWGLVRPGGGYLKIVTLRSLHAVPIENIKVFDYRGKFIHTIDKALR